MTIHEAFKIRFKADLRSEAGPKIAKAAHVALRAGEIDNEWKDRVGRGDVGPLYISVSRTNTHHEWTISATTTDDDYDKDAADALRQGVLAALREHADGFKEFPSELNPGG